MNMAMLKSVGQQAPMPTAAASVRPGKPGKPGKPSKGGGQLTPEALLAKMHLTPQKAQQLDRIVLAGKKAMFSEQSHSMMLDQLKAPGPISQKIGTGVAGLVGLLWQESQQSLDPSLLVPAGVILCAVVAEFLRGAGQEVSDQEVGSAIETMTHAVLSAGGVDPDKLANAGARGAQGAAPSAAPAPTAPEGEPA